MGLHNRRRPMSEVIASIFGRVWPILGRGRVMFHNFGAIRAFGAMLTNIGQVACLTAESGRMEIHNVLHKLRPKAHL